MSEAKQDDLYSTGGYRILTNATVFTLFRHAFLPNLFFKTQGPTTKCSKKVNFTLNVNMFGWASRPKIEEEDQPTFKCGRVH